MSYFLKATAYSTSCPLNVELKHYDVLPKPVRDVGIRQTTKGWSKRDSNGHVGCQLHVAKPALLPPDASGYVTVPFDVAIRTARLLQRVANMNEQLPPMPLELWLLVAHSASPVTSAVCAMSYGSCPPMPPGEVGTPLGINKLTLTHFFWSWFIANAQLQILPPIFQQSAYINVLDLRECAKLTVIPSYAFQSCVNLRCIELPPSIQEIGKNAFSGCLQWKRKAHFDRVQSVGASAFCGSGIVSLSLPSLTATSRFMCRSCRHLVVVNLPSVVVGSDGMFADCDSLRAVTLSGGAVLTAYNKHAFANCTRLKTLVCGFVAGFSKHMFENCKLLQQLPLSSTTTEFPERCFTHTSMPQTVPPYVTHFGEECFARSHVHFLSRVVCTGTVHMGAFFGAPFLTDVDLTIQPAYTTTIAVRARVFANSGVRSVTLRLVGKRRQCLGTEVFANCFNLKKVHIVCTAQLTLRPNSFYRCYALETATIETSKFSEPKVRGRLHPTKSTLPLTLGTGTFMHCQSLKTVTLPQRSFMEWGIFVGCHALLRLAIADGSVADTLCDGCRFDCTRHFLPAGASFFESRTFWPAPAAMSWLGLASTGVTIDFGRVTADRAAELLSSSQPVIDSWDNVLLTFVHPASQQAEQRVTRLYRHGKPMKRSHSSLGFPESAIAPEIIKPVAFYVDQLLDSDASRSSAAWALLFTKAYPWTYRADCGNSLFLPGMARQPRLTAAAVVYRALSRSANREAYTVFMKQAPPTPWACTTALLPGSDCSTRPNINSALRMLVYGARPVPANINESLTLGPFATYGLSTDMWESE